MVAMAAARGRPDLINVNYRMVCMNRTSMLDEYSHGAHEPNKLAVYFGNVVRICRSSCNYFMRQSKYGLDQNAAVPPTRPNAVRRGYIVGFAFCLVYSHARTQILQAHACLNKCACLLFRKFCEYYYTGVLGLCVLHMVMLVINHCNHCAAFQCRVATVVTSSPYNRIVYYVI